MTRIRLSHCWADSNFLEQLCDTGHDGHPGRLSGKQVSDCHEVDGVALDEQRHAAEAELLASTNMVECHVSQQLEGKEDKVGQVDRRVAHRRPGEGGWRECNSERDDTVRHSRGDSGCGLALARQTPSRKALFATSSSDEAVG